MAQGQCYRSQVGEIASNLQPAGSRAQVGVGDVRPGLFGTQLVQAHLVPGPGNWSRARVQVLIMELGDEMETGSGLLLHRFPSSTM